MTQNKKILYAVALVLAFAGCTDDVAPCFPQGPLGSHAGSEYPCNLSDGEFATYGDHPSGLRFHHQVCFDADTCPKSCDEADMMDLILDDLAAEYEAMFGNTLNEERFISQGPLCVEVEAESDCCYSAIFVMESPGTIP